MFLYDKKEKEIDVYSFDADKKALKEYRKKLLENHDINELFYYFETTNENIIDRFLKGGEMDIRFLDHEDNSNDASDWWSKLKPIKASSKFEQMTQESILQEYIAGTFSGIIPTRTFIPDEGVDCFLNSFLVTRDSKRIWSNVEKRPYYIILNLLKLPKELLVLQLLENGKFSEILGTWLDYENLLHLFSAKKIDSVSLKEMKKMFDCGLLQGSYDRTILEVNTTQKILQKIK